MKYIFFSGLLLLFLGFVVSYHSLGWIFINLSGFVFFSIATIGLIKAIKEVFTEEEEEIIDYESYA